ncbi:hypothetical protein ACQB6R_13375 [Propionibacteriaceae bacterium G1746]|uniref:hypothetical protein n=1 Tax=Aestuariimicrobium sp. G57 TaxID=3418485 RepID=UPI003C22497F
MTAIWHFIGLVFASAGDVMLLRPPAELLQGDEVRWGVAIAVVVVSAISGLVGKAGFLAINRVRGFGWVLTLLLVSLQTLVGLVFQGLVLWAAAWAIVNEPPDVGVVVKVVMLSTAPLWFSFFGVMPYLGTLVERVLWAWTLVTLWALMDHLLPSTAPWLVLVVVAVGWLVARLATMLLGAPLQWVRRTVWHAVMRRPLQPSARVLLDAASPQVLAQHHAPPTQAVDAGSVLHSVPARSSRGGR